MMDRLGFACDCRVCLNRWFMDLNWWVRFELVVLGLVSVVVGLVLVIFLSFGYC